MRHLPMIDVMKRAVRETVCTRCFMRPAGSEELPPDVPRGCEGECTIFANMAPLRKIAASMEDDQRGLFERAIQNMICAKCKLAVSGGDFCAAHLAETCPLSVYGSDVIRALDRVREASHAA